MELKQVLSMFILNPLKTFCTCSTPENEWPILDLVSKEL